MLWFVAAREVQAASHLEPQREQVCGRPGGAEREYTVVLGSLRELSLFLRKPTDYNFDDVLKLDKGNSIKQIRQKVILTYQFIFVENIKELAVASVSVHESTIRRTLNNSCERGSHISGHIYYKAETIPKASQIFKHHWV